MNVEAADRLMMGHRIGHDGDVTRQSEVVAVSQAQKTLGTVSLENCEIYTNPEPCALCSYAIDETRIRRVVFGLSSPHMSGVSKWNILVDRDICSAMPEVFAPPPGGHFRLHRANTSRSIRTRTRSCSPKSTSGLARAFKWLDRPFPT
jgi:tRNA(Arg) A34 adenosine deaminase TadA